MHLPQSKLTSHTSFLNLWIRIARNHPLLTCPRSSYFSTIRLYINNMTSCIYRHIPLP